VAVFLTDARGIVTSQSVGIENMLGYSPHDTIGQPADAFVGVGGAGGEISEKLAALDYVERHDISVRTKDGRTVPCHFTAKVLKSADGAVVGTLCILHDMSPRGSLSSVFKDEINLLATLASNSADAIVGFDNHDRIRSWNSGAQAIFGYRKEEAIGRGLSLLLPDRRIRRAIQEEVGKQMNESGMMTNCEILAVDKHGHSVNLEATWTLLRDNEGRPIGKSAVIRDVTEKKRLQANELHSQRLAVVGRMAARIAHEVKNPLASIRLNIEMLESEFGEIPDKSMKKEACELLRSVISEVERLDSITREYLSYTSIPNMRFRRQNLHQMLRELQDFMKKEMASRNIKFVRAFSKDVPNIHFDKECMKEAVLNLYKNAAEAMPGGGKIKTMTRLSGDWVEIVISDTGPGVPDSDAEKLFEPFFSTKSMGTGLGLPVARDILAAHGGSVEVCSGSGEGAAFLLKLPLGNS